MHNDVEALEARQLLASINTGTDTDGDLWTVKVTGPGQMTVDATPGADFGITSLLLGSSPTSATKVTITVKKQGNGDGRLRIKDISLTGDAGSFIAPTTDIAEFGQFAALRIGQLSLGDLSNGVSGITGLVKTANLRDLKSTSAINFTGAVTNTTSVKIRSVETGSTLVVGSRASTISAGTVSGFLNLQGGLGDLRIANASEFKIEVGGNAPINSVVSKSTLTLTDSSFFQRLNKLSATALTLSVAFTQGVGSITSTVGGISGNFGSPRVDSLTAKTSFSCSCRADSWGSITAASISGATIRYVSAATSGFVIGSIKAGSVTDSDLLDFNGSGAFRIKSINVGSWTGGSIQANAIESIKAKTDFAPSTVNLSGESEPFAIKSITVGGNLRGTFRLDSDIVSLKAGTTGTDQTPLQLLTISYGASVDILKFELTGSGSSNLNIQANTIGTLKAKGDLQPQIQLFGTDAKGLSIKSLAARLLSVGDISGVGGIGSITAKRIDGVGITSQYLTTLNITGGDGLAGDFNNENMAFSGTDGGGYSLKTFKAKGGFLESNILAAGSIGAMTIDRIINSSIAVGSTNTFGLPANLNGFEPNAQIDSLTLTKPFSPQAGGFAFSNSAVVASTIAKVTIAGLVDTSNGSPIGFGAKTFGTVTLKDLAGATVKPTIPTSPQDFAPFPNSADFIFRVYA